MALEVVFGKDDPVPNQLFSAAYRQSAYHEVSRDADGNIWLLHSQAYWQYHDAADPLEVWTEIHVPTDTGSGEPDPANITTDGFSVVANPTLGAMISFHIPTTFPTVDGLYVRRIDANQALHGSPVQLRDGNTGQEGHPLGWVGQHPTGFQLIYGSYDGGTPGQVSIYTRQYLESTLAWDTAGILWTSPTPAVGYSHVVFGIAMAAYLGGRWHTSMKYRNRDPGAGVHDDYTGYLSAYYVDGVGFTGTFDVLGTTTQSSLDGSYTPPKMAVHPLDVESIVVHSTFHDDAGPPYTVSYGFWERNQDGTFDAWYELATFETNTNPAGGDFDGDIRFDRYGNLHVVYCDLDANDDVRIYYRVRSRVTGLWSDPVQVSFKGTESARPRLAEFDDESKQVMVFWRDKITGHADTKYSQQTTWWNVGEITLDIVPPNAIYVLDGNVGGPWCRWKGSE